MKETFFKYLDGQFKINEFEKWVYHESGLETSIGKENYLQLIEFNFKQKDSQLELQRFILANIINKNEFFNWKVEYILKSADISFPKDNLYLYAKSNSNFLKNKTLSFNQFKTNKLVELVFTKEITQFINHTDRLNNTHEEFLYLGSYQDSYIHLIVNQKNEIWIVYDITDKKEYFALNIFEAIKKLMLAY